MPSDVWDTITHPFPNSGGITAGDLGSLTMDQQFHPTLYNRCYYLFFIQDLMFIGISCGPQVSLHLQWCWIRIIRGDQGHHGHLARYVNLRVAHAPEMPGTFSPQPRNSDAGIHHGTCIMHVPWCMTVSLTRGFLWSRWRGKRSGIPGACETHNFTIW